jgi:hypothetical protein
MDELIAAPTESLESKPIDLMDIESRMLAQTQVEIPTDHIFSGGVYIRQITVPAGTLIMGKRHRHETCNMLLKGTLLVYVDENLPPIPMTAPMIFTTPPGTKKFAYCQDEVVFINVLPTKETDIDEIERQFIIPETEYRDMIEIEKGAMKCLS